MDKELLRKGVSDALTEIIDPETHLSIMRMGIVKNVTIQDDGAVSLTFRPSSPTCPMAYALAGAIKNKIESIQGVKSLTIGVENFSNANQLEQLINL
ncbi:MAG: metal-sulfur cluster assembly factor [Desulfomonilaceae bacterium]